MPTKQPRIALVTHAHDAESASRSRDRITDNRAQFTLRLWKHKLSAWTFNKQNNTTSK